MGEIFVRDAFGLPVSQEAVMVRFPEFTFGKFQDPPGQVWADFSHQTDEFVVVAQGMMQVTVGALSETCRPGDLVRIPSGVSHSLTTSWDAGSVWFYGYGKFGVEP